MSRRSNCRRAALQVLYQDDLQPGGNPGISDAFIQTQLKQADLIEFARDLVAGVRLYRKKLDEAITEVAEHWTLERMAATDRNVLRLGAFEILHTETPNQVVVNEAVDLAKRFGTTDSGSFVNGILDKLMHASKTDAAKTDSPK